MKNLTLLFSTLLLSALNPAVVSAESIATIKENGEFKICVHKKALPFSEEKSASGMHIDLATLIAEELKVPLKLAWVNLPRYAKYVKCDAFMGVGIFPGEEEGFLKKTKPYAQIEILSITNTNRQLKSLDDFNGLRVATTSGSLIHMALLKQDTEIFVSHLTDDAILTALANGDVDVGIVANSGWGWYKKNNPQATDKFHSQSTKFLNPTNGYPLGIGFRSADKATVTEANEILDRIKERGDMAKLLYKYGLEPAK
jgi:ABC-type amino acid transport substrate-binding protein